MNGEKMGAEKVRGPLWALLFMFLFAFLAVGGITGGSFTLGGAWAVLAFSSWRRYEGISSRLIWAIGVLLLVIFFASLLLGTRLP